MRTLTIIIGFAVAVCACDPEPILAGDREPSPAVEPDEPERSEPREPMDEPPVVEPDAGTIDAVVDAGAGDALTDASSPDAAPRECGEPVYRNQADAADRAGALYRNIPIGICRRCPNPCPPGFTGVVSDARFCDQCSDGCSPPPCPIHGQP